MSLEPVADGVFVWRQDGRLGLPNAGVVVDDDGLTLVDSLATPAQARRLAEALEVFEAPVRRLVLSSSHVEYVGGSSVFALPAVYGRPQASALLDQEPNAGAYQHLLPDQAAELAELTTRRVTHMVTEAAWLSSSVVAVPVAGQMAENLVVQVPHANVVFAGALCRFGATPLGFDADFEAWIASLAYLTELGQVIVPGHGPVGGHVEVADLAGYLAAVVEGAAAGRFPPGTWDDWADRDLDEINLERAAMLAAGDPSPPPSALRRLGLA